MTQPNLPTDGAAAVGYNLDLLESLMPQLAHEADVDMAHVPVDMTASVGARLSALVNQARRIQAELSQRHP